MGSIKVIKCFDLCCGAGALSEGFRRAGSHVLGGLDVCAQAISSARKNHTKAQWDLIAIEDFSSHLRNGCFHPALKANTLLAGLPCQGFSQAGNRDPKDPRNSLYVHLLQIVKIVKPKHVVCENVVGFAEPRNRLAFESLQEGLSNLGYDVSTRILDAADYGVPQNRKRVFLIAVLNGRADWVFECIRPHQKILDVRTAFRGLSSTNQKKVISHVFMNHGSNVKAKLRRLKPGGPISYRRLIWDELAPTLIAGHRALPVHPVQPRAITVREAARLQSFEDSYLFEGSNTSQITQVANAVPPRLAMAIGNALKLYQNHAARIHGQLYKRLSLKSNWIIRRRLAKTFKQTFDDKVRSFPWRKTKDPYKILITELLLQRTNAKLAETIWKEVLEIVPNARAAELVDLRLLGALTSRIGIHSRAHTIKEIGRILQKRHNAKVPDAFDDLLRLPGVGIYIASAVRSLSFGKADFPVDSNAFRFVSRYFGIRLRCTKVEGRQIREFMSTLIPEESVKEFIYGFLDFAATICKPLNPICSKCQLRRNCKQFNVQLSARRG
jgi:DNA (cytosine-5)-methyltransferase 1